MATIAFHAFLFFTFCGGGRGDMGLPCFKTNIPLFVFMCMLLFINIYVVSKVYRNFGFQPYFGFQTFLLTLFCAPPPERNV